MNRWLKKDDGSVSGPHSLDALESMAKHGKLEPYWEISEDQEKWELCESAFPTSFANANAPQPVPIQSISPQPIPIQRPVMRPLPNRTARPMAGQHLQYAGAPPQGTTGRQLKKNSVYLAGCVLVLFGFFLPWVDVTIFSISGYEIAGIANKMSQIGDAFSNGSGGGPPPKALVLYLLYLIPVMAGIGGFGELTANPSLRKNKALKIVIALTPVIVAVLIIAVLMAGVPSGTGQSSEPIRSTSQSASSGIDWSKIIGFVGIGLWLTLAGVITSVVGASKQQK